MKITGKLAALATKTIFKIKKASPEILVGIGVVGVVAAVVLAVKATPHAEDILAEHNEELDDMLEQKQRLANNVLYSDDYKKSLEKEYSKNIAKRYIKTVGKLAKNYAIPFAVLLASLAAIIGSHVILSRRNLELLAAYKALDEAYKKHRESTGQVEPDISNAEHEEAGNSKGSDISNTFASPYAKFFDELNPNWSKDPTSNMFFLKAQQQFANDKFDAQGYLFLNDVYDSLGIPRTSAGQLVGWFKGNGGDDVIDFGIFDGNNENKRAFVNGLERSILLDFNVDGVIYDLI